MNHQIEVAERPKLHADVDELHFNRRDTWIRIQAGNVSAIKMHLHFDASVCCEEATSLICSQFHALELRALLYLHCSKYCQSIVPANELVSANYVSGVLVRYCFNISCLGLSCRIGLALASQLFLLPMFRLFDSVQLRCVGVNCNVLIYRCLHNHLWLVRLVSS